ncbi:MAG: C69 family dipeptidase, partial [bacterium]
MSLIRLNKKLFITIMTVLLVTVFSITSLACTDVMVGKEASADGSVITSHTVDGHYDARIKVIPG